jgi:hypothetical protein
MLGIVHWFQGNESFGGHSDLHELLTSLCDNVHQVIWDKNKPSLVSDSKIFMCTIKECPEIRNLWSTV